MAKRLNKNDITRGRIFDKLAEVYGASVLGMYEGKLRIEIIDDETDEVVQFSLAPVVHKVLVEETECDPYTTTQEKIDEYQASLKKNEPKVKKPKLPKVSATKKTVSAADVAKKAEAIIAEGEFNFGDEVETPKKAAEPVISVDEEAKINALMSELGF